MKTRIQLLPLLIAVLSLTYAVCLLWVFTTNADIKWLCKNRPGVVVQHTCDRVMR